MPTSGWSANKSVILGLQFPDPSSAAAEEGTLAHELAELKVRNYFFTIDFGKRKLNAEIKKLKANEDLGR